jgi:hypothetical protein
MAAALQNLHRITMGGSTAAGRDKMLSFWMGATDDAPAVVEAAGWFNIFSGLLQKGDIIIMSMTRAGVPVTKTYTVTVNTGAAVTVA